MNKLENSKILVIGGAGFIGSFLVVALLKEQIKLLPVYIAPGLQRVTKEDIK